MDELKELIRGLKASVDKVHEDFGDVPAVLAQQVRTNKWNRRLGAALAVVVLVFGLVLWRAVAWVSCTNDWASKTTDRSNAIVGPSNARIDTLGIFMIDYAQQVSKQQANPKAPVDPKVLKRLVDELNAVAKAFQAYPAVAAAHPIPPSPSSTCGLL
jgi:hypothetical protein